MYVCVCVCIPIYMHDMHMFICRDTVCGNVDGKHTQMHTYIYRQTRVQT